MIFRKKKFSIEEYEKDLKERFKKAFEKSKKEFDKVYYELFNKNNVTRKDSLKSCFSSELPKSRNNNLSDLVKMKKYFPETDPENLPISKFLERRKMINNFEEYEENESIIEHGKKFKGAKLTEGKIDLYSKVFKKYDLKKLEGEEPTWPEVFNWVSKSKDENGDPLISDDRDREKQRKSFENYRSKHKLTSFADFENLLKI